MSKFIEEAEKLAKSIEKTDSKNAGESPAIDLLYSYADKGINILNDAGHKAMNVHRLHADLVPLFFHFENSGAGFVISCSGRYVFFMQSDDNKVFIYGTNKSGNKQTMINGRKMSQLFNLDIKEKNGNVTLFDSTGNELAPGEVVLLTLKWCLP